MYGMISAIYLIYIDALVRSHDESLWQHCILVYPYPPVSYHDEFQEARQIYHLQCTRSKTRYILQQHTFQQLKLLVGVDSWYTPLTPSCTARLDASTIKKIGPHNRISVTRWTIKWTIMSKMMKESTSPFDKGQWQPHSPIHPIFQGHWLCYR